MNFSTAVLLGIVQGLTELFPVSSSGHMVILRSFFPSFQQPGVAFDVVVHVGTLVAIVVYFRTEIWNITKSLLPQNIKDSHSENNFSTSRKLLLLIIIGTIPAAFFGLLFQEKLHVIFNFARAAAFFLIITGFLLFISDKVKNTPRQEADMNFFDAILIGLAQSFALLPGISRSGATITMGIFRGINRTAAARFSFLLSLPAICGSVILELPYLKQVPSGEILAYFAGFLCAALAGLASLNFFFLIIRQARLKYFSYYCWTFALFTLLVKSSFF
ncbi:MAG TPA: undecaprenyl-diphosphate phosphatase [Deltaproteobacteria bacterium]|nr:undecaprenyl-diphosphate phosphatase [Deltaproteobacteria bacterium]